MYLYMRIYHNRMNNLDRAFYLHMRETLTAFSLVRGKMFDEVEVYYIDEKDLVEKLGSELLFKLGDWAERGLIAYRKSNVPTLPPKPSLELSPPSVKEAIEKYSRKIWSAVRKVPWGKIATILGKSIYIGAKHLTLAGKEIVEMVMEEIRKKPEQEQVPLLITISSLIEARRRNEISEKEFLDGMRAISRQLK